MASRGRFFVELALQTKENLENDKNSSNNQRLQNIPLHDLTNSAEIDSPESTSPQNAIDKEESMIHSASAMTANENVVIEKEDEVGHVVLHGNNIEPFIPNSSDMALKENTVVEKGPIYTPQQYATLIRTAKKTGPPYVVEEMTKESFFDVKALQEEWGTNFNLDVDKNQVKWHDIKILRVEKQTPGAFFYKTSYSDTYFKKTIVQKRDTRNRRAKVNEEPMFSGQLTKAYNTKIPLSANKKNDIKELLDKNVIPRSYYDSYYKNVLD